MTRWLLCVILINTVWGCLIFLCFLRKVFFCQRNRVQEPSLGQLDAQTMRQAVSLGCWQVSRGHATERRCRHNEKSRAQQLNNQRDATSGGDWWFHLNSSERYIETKKAAEYLLHRVMRQDSYKHIVLSLRVCFVCPYHSVAMQLSVRCITTQPKWRNSDKTLRKQD